MVEPRKLFGGLGNRLFQMAYIYAQARKGEIPDIYIQDEKYFAPYQEEVRALYSEGIESIDMVSIHVRRGDYVNNPFYVDLSETAYYEEAMAHFPGEKFLVFSDDIEWCIRQEVFYGCSFSENKTEIEDLNLMAGCKAHIIANSSFSWWAAFISGKKTIAPTKWFTDGLQRITLPASWIQI